jgi:hypothetical protein
MSGSYELMSLEETLMEWISMRRHERRRLAHCSDGLAVVMLDLGRSVVVSFQAAL